MPSFCELSDQYQSVKEILEDPELEAYAFAADIKKSDLANILIKRFSITQCVMNQQVEIPFFQKGETHTLPLLHPDSGEPLIYQDFLTDRSGPKFGGYLDDSAGKVYLITDEAAFNAQRAQLITSRVAATKEKFFPLKLNEEKLQLAASVFKRPHRTQRRLSDFDLTAGSLTVFEEAVREAVKKRTGFALPPMLGSVVAQTLWEVGGEIDIALIERAMADPNFDYRKAIESQRTASESHILVQGPGKKMSSEGIGEPHVDATYGLGIAYMGPEVRQDIHDPSKMVLTSELVKKYQERKISKDELQKYFPQENIEEVIKHKGLYEIGDIICDSRSHYEQAFTHEKNARAAWHTLREKIGSDKWQKIREELQITKAPTPTQLKEIIEQEKAQEVGEQFERNRQFISEYSLFEECAKKDAQSQIFKLDEKTKGKLIGNISDVEPFILGVVEKARSDDALLQSQAKANLQITMLSLMINAPRWGINETNYQNIGKGEEVTTEAFQKSINARSYAYDEHAWGPRKEIGWYGIENQESQRRLANFQHSMNHAWLVVRSQKDYFEKVGQFKHSLKAIDELEKALKNTTDPDRQEDLEDQLHVLRFQAKEQRSALHTEIERVIASFPELHNQIKALNPDERDQAGFLTAMTAQAEQSVVFGLKRETKLTVKEALKKEAVEQPIDMNEKQDYVMGKSALTFRFDSRNQEKSPHHPITLQPSSTEPPHLPRQR